MPGSIPVVAFGDARKAWIATLAINPSFGEFLHSDGRERDGIDRRLETLRSLCCKNLAGASKEAIQIAFKSCNSYFTRKPYTYFRKLETVLSYLDASFYNGSACHLDLVQWATKPRWKELHPWERQKLLEADMPFLSGQLALEHLRVVVINGSGVREQYEKFFGIRLEDVLLRRQNCFEISGGRHYIKFFQRRASPSQVIVGWNINLQTTPGVSKVNVEAIGERISRIVSRMHQTS